MPAAAISKHEAGLGRAGAEQELKMNIKTKLGLWIIKLGSWIGRFNLTLEFNAHVNTFSLYDNVLSPAEIKALYEAGDKV